MPSLGIALGDILADSGYAHRDAAAWAIPLRRRRPAGADLHPHDRGPQGTHHGAVIANGNLYCPPTPKPLLELGPLPPGAAPDAIAAHDQQPPNSPGTRSVFTRRGHRRLPPPHLPSRRRKIRCPLRPASMKLDRNRPEILTPPGDPPACCTQQTITVPPGRRQNQAETRLPLHRGRTSYQRRTAAERFNATIKDTATSSIDRGWFRLTGLTPLTLWLACLTAVRNQRNLHARHARQQDNTRRAAAGLPPATRKRRRTTAPSAPPRRPN